MNRIKISPDDLTWENLYPRISLLIKGNQRTWQAVGVISGLAGGALSFVAAVALDAVGWLTQSSSAQLRETSFIALLLVLPLLALGAHCLDLLEKDSSDVQNAGVSLADSRTCFDVQNAKM